MRQNGVERGPVDFELPMDLCAVRRRWSKAADASGFKAEAKVLMQGIKYVQEMEEKCKKTIDTKLQ